MGLNLPVVTRKALLADLACNALLPWLGYEFLKRYFAFSDFRALLWITLIPVTYGLVTLLRERRFSLVAGLSLFSLLLSLVSALLSKDERMLLIRESFCTALFGGVFLLSALLQRPLIYLMMREQATDLEQRGRLEGLWAHPAGRRFINGLTLGVGGLCVSEFLLKWWMVHSLPIATVLWLGPLVLKGMAGLLFVMAFWAARRLKARLAGDCPGLGQGSST